jgi:hypothetical protein
MTNYRARFPGATYFFAANLADRNASDYIHFNPVEHGHVNRIADWPYSTFTVM